MVGEICNMDGMKGGERLRMKMIVPMTCCMLWKERCQVVFIRKNLDVIACIEKIKSSVNEIWQSERQNQVRERQVRQGVCEEWRSKSVV